MGRLGTLFELQTAPVSKQSGVEVVRVCLFRDVQNAADLLAALKAGELQCSVIRAELVMEMFQLLAAANRAVHCLANGKLATRSIHSEIVYSLSPSKNIADSLSTFGVSAESTDVLIAIHGDCKGEQMAAVAKRVRGRPVELCQLREVTDYALVKRAYHVKEPELNKSSMVDAVVMRIVAKDHVA